MKKIYNEIYEKIKEYDKIVIARHIGADIDALGSTLGLKEVITNTFPKKKVSVVGAYSSVFKFMAYFWFCYCGSTIFNLHRLLQKHCSYVVMHLEYII